jgi:hypothetical protein
MEFNIHKVQTSSESLKMTVHNPTSIQDYFPMGITGSIPASSTLILNLRNLEEIV